MYSKWFFGSQFSPFGYRNVTPPNVLMFILVAVISCSLSVITNLNDFMKSLRNSFDKSFACAIFPAFVLVAILPIEILSQQTNAPVKVMSFNIRYGTARDGENHWSKRHQLVRETIDIFDPDLLGVQEALPFQCEYLQEHFPEYDFFGRGRQTEPNQGEFCAIFFRRSRFEKREGGHFWLSETPEQAGSRGWDAALPRMVTWVRLRDQSSGQEFVFANTHYDHRGVLARKKSSEVIRSWISSQVDVPIVLTGDFNAAVGSDPYNALLDADANTRSKLIDSYRSIHRQTRSDEGTFGAWTGKRDGPRIDWILTSPEFSTLNASINYHNDSARFPSDHFPVQTVIRIHPQKQ